MEEFFAWNEGVAASTTSQVTSAGHELLSRLGTLAGHMEQAKKDGKWDAIEEEQFQEIFQNWRKGAEGIFKVLESVSALLGKSNEAVIGYRAQLKQALG